MRDGLLERTTSKGYWRVNLRPTSFDKTALTLPQCLEAVQESKVQLRGWDYPHIQNNREHGDQGPAGDYYESWTDWTHHIEFWRMYRSSQFLHYRALWEDWLGDFERESAHVPEESLGVVGAIYTVTEMFEFLARLARRGLFREGVTADISLRNAENRELWVDTAERMGFLEPRRTLAATVQIRRSLTLDQAISSSAQTALDVLLELFDNFGWAANKESIEQDQTTYLAGRSWQGA